MLVFCDSSTSLIFFHFVKNASTLLNNFFPRFSIVMDDTDDNERFVWICVGNVLSIVGKGGNLSLIHI